MFAIGILFMIVSVLLSGKTRRLLFWGASRHICAKVLNSMVFVLCYILFIIWFLITCVLIYPLFLNAYYKFLDCKVTQHNSTTAGEINENCMDARCM
jgi:hypothetical protein